MNIPKVVVALGIVGILNFGFSFGRPLAEVAWNAHQSTSWPQTTGLVTQSAVQHDRRGRPHALVSYSYDVRGQMYQSSTVQFAGSTQTESEAQAMVQQYPVGKSVSVFFKPSDPRQAVLIPGLTSTIPLFMLAAGVLAVAAGFASVLAVVVRARRLGSSDNAAPR